MDIQEINAENRSRREELDAMVLSASGWRGVFGTDDHSMEPVISRHHRDLVAAAAVAFAEELKRRAPGPPPMVVVGTDTRPTGPMIADTAIRAFYSQSVSVRWLGVSAAPELMNYTRQDPACAGFFYISASHNPPGHNGLKMGFADGAVMPGSAAYPLIERFRAVALDDEQVKRIGEAVARVPAPYMERIFRDRDTAKSDALSAYRAFSLRVGRGPSPFSDAEFVSAIRDQLAVRPLGVVAELNGSARCESIDRSFLAELGVRLAVYNDISGTFAHQILPEGDGLSDAAELRNKHNRLDPAFQVAYVPDNDGDRGNLVFHDPVRGSVPLDAQSVFALVVMIELAWLRECNVVPERVAVVANGPTSLRIDRICDHFGATLERAEVGEANVVQRARELTDEGWVVAILGEGSNGGNITPPATVRDPMSTLLALVKLHSFSLASHWDGTAPAAETFLNLLERLPRFETIATDDPRAKMHVGAIRHGDLKARYEAQLPEALSRILPDLEGRYGTPINHRIMNYEGTTARGGAGARSGEERGGFRVVFFDEHGVDRAAVWMRGSGTEPVFRVLADCEGDDTALLDRLISWHRELVEAAADAASLR
ncbi:MAG: phosphatidylglycerol lysyltransferase [Spirochaeta sp.]|nr:phosphatidylglycerol lysyltransferase [Spirochaeta sp.]